MEHRPAAILHADVKGYSRLIAADERATLRTLTPDLEMMSSAVQQHSGQAVGSRGDSLLAEFPSVVEVVQCAVEMQRFLSRYPNRLDIHLMLAAVYSEVDQAAEACAEAAEVLRLNPHFSLAVHQQTMPIKDPTVPERQVAALRKAGLR